jgi:16S rRNA (adenine1518-N6/adenine1519-N6)-dimethyltransferase
MHKHPTSLARAPKNHPRARKRFGQHFLTRPSVARRIVELAELTGRESVLEIGPGQGALTQLLEERAAHLYLVEIDRDLAERLRAKYADKPNVDLVEGDVLKMDLARLLKRDAPVAMVANLPYNISSPVLMKTLDTPQLFSRMVLMLQREVAERICAQPGTKVYGALSIVVQLVARARATFSVPPSAFSPQPKVHSSVVVIEPYDPMPLTPSERIAVRRIVRTAFSQRRKQLANALAPLVAQPREILRDLDIDPQRRPETLPPGEFLRLARAVGAKTASS